MLVYQEKHCEPLAHDDLTIPDYEDFKITSYGHHDLLTQCIFSSFPLILQR
jgi:hypothetical protein